VRETQLKLCYIECRSNTRLQWIGVAPRPVSWDATSAWDRRSISSGVWMGRSRILSGEQSLDTYVAPSASSTGFRFFFRHLTISAINLLLFVLFATLFYNSLYQYKFRSLLSISKHGRLAWEKIVCSVQSRYLRSQQQKL